MIKKELVVDKSFFDNFLRNYNEEDSSYSDFTSFIRRLRDFDITINYASQEEFENAIKTNPLLDYLVDTKVPKIEFNPNLLDDILNDSFYKDQYPIRLFLTEINETQINDLRSKYGFEFISTDLLKDRWPSYSSYREDRKMKVSSDPNLPQNIRFDSWESLLKFTHPIHTVVIFDRYLLAGGTNQQLKDNLYPLLEYLLKKSSTQSKLNITIITEKFKSSIESIHEQILSFLNNELKLDVHLNIIVHNRAYYPAGFEGLHWRRIYTNYFTIKSDDSFNFFKPNGKVNQKAEIEFEYIFNNYEWQSYIQDIKDLSKYVKKVENRPAIGYDSPKINFYQDKINRILNSA